MYAPMDGQSDFIDAPQASERTYKEVVYYLILLEYGILASKPNQCINEWLSR
jgi:hypothetical protein